jgi:hypothetical protein
VAIWDGGDAKTRGQTVLTTGSNIDVMAALRGGLSKPDPRVQRLLNLAEQWDDHLNG